MATMMASFIPAFMSAMQDRALRGHAREVYIWMHEHLDIRDYRVVKHSVVKAALGLADSRLSAAIDRLIEREYIERGPPTGRLKTYRLLYSRPL